MKHIPPAQVAGETLVKLPTRRALAKQQTRAKVLAAARQLFSEHGYEGATIRDIATAAGMSTGAVFANFTDKSDLFFEIMAADMANLCEAMREASVGAPDVESALLGMFMAGYSFYQSQLPLARAAFSVSWAPQDGPTLRNAPQARQMRTLIAEALDKGVERGELLSDPHVKLRGRMLFDAYLSNYPNAIFADWSLEALQDRARDQIRILLASARRG